MAYDIINEALTAVQTGDITINEFMNQIDSITNSHLMTKLASGNSDSTTFDITMERREDDAPVTVRVTLELVSGGEVLQGAREFMQDGHEEVENGNITMNDLIERTKNRNN